MKRLFAAIMCAALLCGVLAGCTGKKNTAVNTEDPNTVPADPYEINWYMIGDAQSDVSSVEEVVNAYLKDKINATVKINALPSAQYKQKVGTMINANEYFDLCFVAAWMLDYTNNARAGAFVDLTDYLDTYLKDAAEEIDDVLMKGSKVDDRLYAWPTYKEVGTCYGWIYRKDLADKYNIDMSKYHSYEELEPVLKLIKENEPDITYPLDWSTDGTPAQKFRLNNYICQDGVFPDDHAMNVYETEEFAEACATARDFYQKGYVRPDVLTATDRIARMSEGKTFVICSAVKPGKAQELFANSTYEFAEDCYAFQKPCVDYAPGTGSMQAVSATSKNPARVMRFLNLLNTDPYLKNLIVHGIEGKHYTKIDDKTVQPIGGSGYDMYKQSYAIGNIFLDYLIPGEDPDKYEKLKEYNKIAVDSKTNYFVLSENPELERLQQEVKTVTDKYRKQCITGAVAPESILPEFRQQLEVVGMPRMLEIVEEQWQEFLKNYDAK